MLSNIEFPDIRVPTFMERFIKFKDGIRKSASYRSKHVSPISPDQGFRIDGEAPSPVVQKFHTVADFRRPPNATVPSFSEERRQAAANRPNGLEVIMEGSDHDSQQDCGPDDVLIISRDGGDNFTINDTTTMGTGSPLSPYPSTRHPPSAYSGDLTPTTSTGMTRSSWLPRRANTSSTVSGAYPHELRRDPDLVSPPSWANKFPDPPQTFSAAVRSARTLPTPPVPVPSGQTGP
ncbi:hypothetical protein OH76DRAFT_138063 [Lentinus brumalis]|uniref:Uncharacterized protein n=1 Tax=Lentinus brumalis TaxID=2498619 RepID=A0A371CPN2_9APHY|nr:hypothetical protein OH76DRAFT_138063 [Polyporus brumalis]